MRVTVNDKEVIFPSSLSEFTLGQRIDFHNEHGKILDEMAASIDKMEGEEREIELSGFQMEKMFRTFAFFAGTTVEAVKESEFVETVANIYYSCLAVLFEEEDKLDLQQTFQWKGETWVLHPPELKNGSQMRFGEFIDSKQVVKDMVDLGKGKWEYMLPLCAIYLRKEKELYTEDLLYEDSERLALMRELPMDIAMQVGFFFTSSMNIWINTFLYSGSQEPKAAEDIRRLILTNGDG